MKASLLILGVLHRGNFHPYEIKRRLTAAMVECYSDVDVGTLYYAIRQLEKEGLIATVSQERVARGGMRTVYKITKAGRAEFRNLLHAQFDLQLGRRASHACGLSAHGRRVVRRPASARHPVMVRTRGASRCASGS